jgi:nucleoside-diphosphate-sugar epimerase
VKVLLTGATGYLGRAVTELLVARGAHVWAIVRRADTALPPGVTAVPADLTGPEGALATAAAGMDVVVHCAAHLGAGSREAHRLVNVAGTRKLLEVAAQAGVRRFVHVSTIAVYGWKEPGSIAGPDDPYEPCPDLRDDYAWSKIHADRWACAYRDHGLLDVAIVRPGIIYGDGRDFVARVWRRLRGPLCAIGGGRSMLVPLVHRRDVADAIVRAAETTRPLPRPLLVVDPDSPRQDAYLSLRAKVRGEEMRPVYVPFTAFHRWARTIAASGREKITPSGSLPYSLAWGAQATRYDTVATQEDLGWSPTISLTDGIATARAT